MPQLSAQPTEKKTTPQLPKKKTTPLPVENTGILASTVDSGRVYVERGVTKNLGDYNNAKITVGIELPIHYTPDDLKQAQDAIKVATEIVEKEIEQRLSELNSI